MLFLHERYPERRVRLAYCLNLHPANDLAGTKRGIEEITLRLKERLAPDAPFGVGLWLPADVAHELASDDEQCAAFAQYLVEHGLDPFTFNAFPYGGFHDAGLKAEVFKPTWMERDRLNFTLDVARVAEACAEAAGTFDERSHVSISTHPGLFGAWREPGDEDACAENFARCVNTLAEREELGGLRFILGVEAEPRAVAGDSTELAAWLTDMREKGAAFLHEAEGLPNGFARLLLNRHLGTCLDCCHAAVEFEGVGPSLDESHAGGGRLAKLQFSSAVSLREPRTNEAGRRALLGMAEERYLHQVTARSGARVDDLPQLEALLAAGGEAAEEWLGSDEWRCHFHVPVDLAELDQLGQLGTTRAHADATLSRALLDPESWHVFELHLEIETYTWDILAAGARGTGDLVDGLEREYRHVLGLLDRAGWKRG